MKDMIPEFQKMLMRAPYDVDKTLPYYRSLAKDIVKQKNRLGGNFVIAQAVSKRIQRDCMKEIFGSQGIFVLLKLSKETNAKRIEGRHVVLIIEPTSSCLQVIGGSTDLLIASRNVITLAAS